MTDDDAEDLPTEEIFAEMRARTSAALALTNREVAPEAREQVRNVFLRRCRKTSTIEDRITCVALAKIAGEDLRPFGVQAPQVGGNWERFVTQTIAHAWSEWAQGRPGVALEVIPRLRAMHSLKQEVTSGAEGGAVNLMTMNWWMCAVECLAKGEHLEATRFWKRALEVGSQHGTNSNKVVSWTYVASFFPTK